MQHKFFENFKINTKKDGYNNGSEFVSELIKSKMTLLEMHRELIKSQAKMELKILTQNLRSLMENENFPPNVIDNIMTNMNEETLKALEKM